VGQLTLIEGRPARELAGAQPGMQGSHEEGVKASGGKEVSPVGRTETDSGRGRV